METKDGVAIQQLWCKIDALSTLNSCLAHPQLLFSSEATIRVSHSRCQSRAQKKKKTSLVLIQ